MAANEPIPLSPEWAAAYGRASYALYGLNGGNRSAFSAIALKAQAEPDNSIVRAPHRAACAFQNFNVEVLGGVKRATSAVASMMGLRDEDIPEAVKPFITAAKEKLDHDGVDLSNSADVAKALSKNLTDGKIGPITRAAVAVAERVGSRSDPANGRPLAADKDNPSAMFSWARAAAPSEQAALESTVFDLAEAHVAARAKTAFGARSAPQPAQLRQ